MSEASKLIQTMNEIQRLDERYSLNEMATVISKSSGLGIEIKIYSEDHPPAHMHVYDSGSGSLIARVIIPSSKPSSIKSIRPYGDEILTNEQKKVILRALNMKSRKTGTAIWKRAIEAWDLLHPDFPA